MRWIYVEHIYGHALVENGTHYYGQMRWIFVEVCWKHREIESAIYCWQSPEYRKSFLYGEHNIPLPKEFIENILAFVFETR